MSDHDALLRAICERPDDDTVRLVYADWLDGEHNGKSDRAEFIRLQIANPIFNQSPHAIQQRIRYLRRQLSQIGLHPDLMIFGDEFDKDADASHKFRRGFVDEIRCTIKQFMGHACEWCNQTGWVKGLKPAVVGAQMMPRKPCKFCRGTGTMPGLARTLFGTHPITRVTLTDIEPVTIARLGPSREQYGPPSQFVHYGYEVSGPDYIARHAIPKKLFDHLGKPDYRHNAYRFYWNTREAALAALSLTCANYARSLHGLGPIN